MYKNYSIIVAGLLMSSAALADVSEERNFEFNLGNGGSFSIENVNGDLDIQFGNTTSVVARLTADTQKLLDGIEIKIDESSNSVSIDTELPKSRRSHVSVDYIVTLPSGVALDKASTVNGDVAITDIEGDINAETVNGDVDATNLNGDIEMETVNGDIQISFVALGGNDTVELETVNGSINVSIPTSADVTVEASNLNGSLKIDDLNIISQKQSRWGPGKSATADSGNGSASLTAESVNGSIKVRNN